MVYDKIGKLIKLKDRRCQAIRKEAGSSSFNSKTGWSIACWMMIIALSLMFIISDKAICSTSSSSLLYS
jgi:hypothetical protein